MITKSLINLVVYAKKHALLLLCEDTLGILMDWCNLPSKLLS